MLRDAFTSRFQVVPQHGDSPAFTLFEQCSTLWTRARNCVSILRFLQLHFVVQALMFWRRAQHLLHVTDDRNSSTDLRSTLGEARSLNLISCSGPHVFRDSGLLCPPFQSPNITTLNLPSLDAIMSHIASIALARYTYLVKRIAQYPFVARCFVMRGSTSIYLLQWLFKLSRSAVLLDGRFGLSRACPWPVGEEVQATSGGTR